MNSLVLASSLALFASPSEAAQDFKAATERALAEDYEQASALYEAILERGYQDGDVYYNLGHVLESAGKPIQAIVAYERALTQNPNDADALANLQALRAELVREGPEPEPGAVSLADAFRPWVRNLPVGLIGWLSVFALLFGFVLRTFASAKGLPASVVAFFLAAFGLSIVGLRGLVDSDHRAVVVSKAPLLEGPDPRFSSRGEMIPGEGVRVLSSQGGFREVQRVDGSTGFVERSALESL